MILKYNTYLNIIMFIHHWNASQIWNSVTGKYTHTKKSADKWDSQKLSCQHQSTKLYSQIDVP